MNEHVHNHQNHLHSKVGESLTLTKISTWKNWLPLIIVIIYIFGLTIITGVITEFNLKNLMQYNMGYFFIIFSLFKLIDLSGFATGYHHYDLISKIWYDWGYLVPFIELFMGILYLLRINNAFLLLATIIFSLTVVLSVSLKLAKKEKFSCACLGTVLKVPLTKISLIEYLFMAIMAGMIFSGI